MPLPLDRREGPCSNHDRDLLMFSDEPLFIFDFDGLDHVRPLNRQAADLNCPREARAGGASPLETEAQSALRDAARRCRVAGHASVDLVMGSPPRALSVFLTPSIEPSRFLLTAVNRACVSKDRLTPEAVAAIAHHVRNPMAGIRGAVEVIGSEVARDHAELAGIIRQITARIDDLDRSLDSMLIYLHPVAPELSRTELGALIERILDEEACAASLRVLDIRRNLADVVLFADAKQLSRTVLDLLTNAAQALRAGRGVVELTLTQDPRFATLTISDAGGGIPPDVLPRVCEPFFTTKPRALGLGLTNANRVAQAHGGKLAVRTADGRTEVQLELPL